jgi:hypothetical protein
VGNKASRLDVGLGLGDGAFFSTFVALIKDGFGFSSHANLRRCLFVSHALLIKKLAGLVSRRKRGLRN